MAYCRKPLIDECAHMRETERTSIHIEWQPLWS